eukprot:364162-Pyramimonas_sp.AAC.2
MICLLYCYTQSGSYNVFTYIGLSPGRRGRRGRSAHWTVAGSASMTRLFIAAKKSGQSTLMSPGAGMPHAAKYVPQCTAPGVPSISSGKHT